MTTADRNPTITELEVEYQPEFSGGEYDGLKFHHFKEPPYEYVFRDIKADGDNSVRFTEWLYRQRGLFVMHYADPHDKDAEAVEWDEALELSYIPRAHIYTLLPRPFQELREVYPEVLACGWPNGNGRGVVVVHAMYDLVQKE